VSTDELLARLARLDASDRAWLLSELPPALRRQLAEGLAEEEQPAVPAPVTPQAPAGWEALEPQRAADVLDTEPAWLVSAATRTADARWRERLLQAMKTRRRHEVEMADRAGRPLGARAVQLVLDGCRERLAGGGVAPRAGTSRHGFAALVDQMKSRFA
jgi:Mg/Co/Ni transporter MgtE